MENHSLATFNVILNDKLGEARLRFQQRVSEEVAEFGFRGQRFGSALVNRLAKIGREEFRSRAGIITTTWREWNKSVRRHAVEEVVSDSIARLEKERHDIEGVVLGVNMGRTRQPPGFLEVEVPSTRLRLEAKIRSLFDGTYDPAGKNAESLVELKPGIWGLSVNLGEAWHRRRLARR